MNELSMVLNQIGKEIQHIVSPESNYDQRDSYRDQIKPRYKHISGRQLNFKEMMEEGLDNRPVQGAIRIVYSPGKFMTVDRIVKAQQKFSRKRRMILDLNSKSGQISASILLEILKIDSTEKFSKHKFLREVEKEYFRENGIILSSSELNETFSRMMRRTFDSFFEIAGKYFKHKNYVLKMEELQLKKVEKYGMYRARIDKITNDLVRSLNVQYT